MANKNLFKSLIGKLTPATNALNEERAPAYLLSPKRAQCGRDVRAPGKKEFLI